MQLLDPQIGDCRALVIDGNPTSRSTQVAMLRDWGVGTVAQTSRPADALKILEERTFDVVLCEQHFDDRGMDGQGLLDELRRNHLLPYSTVFIMVTGEASYAKVAEAAESALDSYLLKPHNAAALGERLTQARRRKRVLRDIFDAMEMRQYEKAALLCLKRFSDRDEYWLYAARVGAELLLRLGRHDAARRMFEAVREARALPWAKLGVARAEIEGGAHDQARRTLESLISANPSYADAYDVMGRVQVEQGDLGSALDTYRKACELTPGSIGRLQKQGMLAFFAGEFAEAEKALDKAVSTGISSKMFDLESLVLQALLKFETADLRGMMRAVDNLQHASERHPESSRIHRFLAIGDVLRSVAGRQVVQVVSKVKGLSTQTREGDFDFEAAANFMALLTRLSRTEVQLQDAELWVNAIALRFAVSKAGTELLCAAAFGHAEYQRQVHDAHARIGVMAEQAMTHSVKGSPAVAVQTLLKQGEETLNAKLIELAGLVLQRHRERIDLYEAMMARVEALKEQYCSKGTRVSLNDTGRQAGALALRS
jgi:CheY-like chemotaxis protein